MKTPMQFFNRCDDVFGTDKAIGVPANSGGTLICDDRYLGLLTIPRLTLLGVKPGTNCQALLSEWKRGFMFYDGSGLGAYTEDMPALNLPYVNPAVAGVFGAPASGVQNLMVGTGDSPSKWQFMAAPSSGSYSLIVQGGLFTLVSGGSIPGLGGVCGTTAGTYAGLVGCVPTGAVDTNDNPIYGLSKLSLTPNRVIVGWTDPSDNATRATTLLDSNPLTHPLGVIASLQCHQFAMTDNTGAPISGGLPVLNTGITDALPTVYSPANKSFYSAGAPTYANQSYNSNIPTSGSIGASYTSVTPHMDFGTVTLNTPNLMIDFQVLLNNTSGQFNAALYIDGVQKYQWGFASASQALQYYTGTCAITGIAPGSHTVAVWVNNGTNTAKVAWSNATLRTMP